MSRKVNTRNKTTVVSNDTYVYGNTVTKKRANVKAEPSIREIRERERQERKNRENQKRQESINRANKFNFLYTVGISSVVAVIFIFSVQYLNTQSKVMASDLEVRNLKEKLQSVTNENDELELEINSSIDYDEIYNTAVNELGMVYPDRNQVITYEAGVSEYVKQYADIPDDKN